MGAEKRKVVIASRNADKVRELAELMADLPFTVVAASVFLSVGLRFPARSTPLFPNR